jgi:saccharopine dehydrogenase-like NADP-dependent oxidoreductase
MQTILILGAGLSSSSLIRYFLEKSETYNWQIRVVDRNIEQVKKKLNGHQNGVGLSFDALNSIERKPEIERADLVISMLPARFHVEVARDCIDLKTHLITPSYVSKEMKALHDAAVEAGILIMNEIGVDPGIDHMSSSKVLDDIQSKGGVMHSFKSFCGGLIAPENDTNPWNYKFTWNPRNVVVAGQGGAACFIEENQYKYIPYTQIFQRLDVFDIDGYGSFEGYANRDSLAYRKIYGLDNIPTIYRGTLRRVGFSKAWNVFVQLGMTDDTYKLEKSEDLTPRTFLNAFLPFKEVDTVENKLKKYFTLDDEELFEKFVWLGIFDDTTPFGIENASPAQLLESLLVEKWKLEEGDKDMLVMYHEFVYDINSSREKIISSMVCIGKNQIYTAMSETVGLPVAICAKMILRNQIQLTGVHIPVLKEVYDPILKELESFGIVFNEQRVI